MRQALGTVVFFGMIGVTFFGVFLTPVFYTAIRYLTDRQPAPAETPLRSVPAYAVGGERRAAGGAHR
jgi:HAE1 family hydrophobic/amphiphilic exporter-1